jgi:putative oxidoreductase
MDTGVLIARGLLGLAISAHGAQKLFGWFGGHGLKGTGAFFDGLGFRPGHVFALAAGLGETGGGLLTALGLFWPFGPALIVLVMVVAIGSVHVSHGFFASSNGIELPLMYLTAALALAFTGPGAVSFDAWLGIGPVFDSTSAWLPIAAAVGAACLSLAMRRPTPASVGTRG